MAKNMPASAEDAKDAGSIPGSGRSLGVGNDNLFQYFCLENCMDRGAWWATVHGGHKKLDMTERLSACACVHTRTHTHTTRLQVSTTKTQLSTKGHTSSICCHCCLLLATLKFGSVTCNPAKQWELEDGVQLSSLHLRMGHILSSMSFFSP